MDTDLGEKGKKSGPAGLSLRARQDRPYTYEPGQNVNPMPDYEAVLTD